MATGSSGEGKEVRSEDELGVKWDRCVADTIIKTGEKGERGRDREVREKR